MNRKNVLSYLLALCVLFAVGSAAALLLREYDRRAEDIAPLAEGRQLSFPLCGFALTVPEDAQVLEADPGDGALYAASIVMEKGVLRFAAYENETGERIETLDAQQLVTRYASAGAEDVRLRTLGGRLFIEYAVTLDSEAAQARRCLLFETWDEHVQLIFETDLSERGALPILASITRE